MIPTILLSTFQDVFGKSISQTIGSDLMIAASVLGCIAFLLFYIGASASVIFVIFAALILSMSWGLGVLPSWVFLITVMVIAVIVVLGAMRIFHR